MNFWGKKKSKAFGNKFGGIKLPKTNLIPFGKSKSKTKSKSKSKKFSKSNILTIPKKDLTWKQAKKRYPKMNPLGDYDKDGVRNWQDCKPFDKKRQDLFDANLFLASSAAAREMKKMDKRVEKHAKLRSYPIGGVLHRKLRNKHRAKIRRDLKNLNTSGVKAFVSDDATYLNKVNEKQLPQVLEHEATHHALQKVIGAEASKKFDNTKEVKRLAKELEEMDSNKEEFVERMRRGKEEAAERRAIMELKAMERQEEQDNWEEEQSDVDEMFEKAEQGELTPEDIVEHERETFDEDYEEKAERRRLRDGE